MTTRLALFDIDGTLLSTAGAGAAAMEEAARSLFGAHVSARGIDFAGRLDPLILREMLRAANVDDSTANLAGVRREYERLLHERLASSPKSLALPGVHDLLEAAGKAGAVVKGLLTGNFETSGRMKLRACGIDPDQFALGAWGDDSPHDPPDREHLPPVAMARYHRIYARTIASRDVVIIGDTPHDVRCALANGCRCVAVATGRFSRAELAKAGATWTTDDLTNTQEILSWIMS